jgi:uncharacterized protein (DUF983 family)
MTDQPISSEIDLHVEAPDQGGTPVTPPRRGDVCPACGKGKLDYNGLLELECSECGFRDTSAASYT